MFLKPLLKIILLVDCLLFSASIFAQIKQANSLFDQFKYSKAIPLYKKVIEGKDENVRIEAIVKLADCYRHMNNANEARVWYAKAVTFPNVKPINYFYLGIALRTLSNYAEAEKAFSEYISKVPGDPKGKIYQSFCKEIVKWEGFPPCAEIRNAESLNSPFSEFGPTFYKDELVFTSDRDIDLLNDRNYLWTSFGYLDLFHSKASVYNDYWSEMSSPEKMPSLFNQPYHDGPACFSSDFRKIFITRTLKSGSRKDTLNLYTDLLKIFMADISNEKKLNFIPFQYNNDRYSVGHPTISFDGNTLIFSSDKPRGYGQSDLYISKLKEGRWSEPENLGPQINTFGNEVFPFLANDSTLYFSSDGLLGYGGLDIFEAKKIGGVWEAPSNLKLPINSPYDDFSIAFDKTLKSGFFSSNRPGGKGSDDIYAFRNFKQVDNLSVSKPTASQNSNTVFIVGNVKDKIDSTPIKESTIFILNASSNEVFIAKSNDNGDFKVNVSPGTLYVLKAMKGDYFDDCTNFRVPTEYETQEFKLPRSLFLSKYSINQTFKIDNIYYDLGKWDIRDDAKPALDNLVRTLKIYPISVELGSHTDSRSTAAYNKDLSQKRAESVVNYLIQKGINPKRLTAKGYGESQLINKCKDGVPCAEEEHQENRRTEFKILSIANDENKKNFDLSIFRNGDKIPVQLLDADFFRGCLEIETQQ